jgi:Flp pilus assembly protein TadD
MLKPSIEPRKPPHLFFPIAILSFLLFSTQAVAQVEQNVKIDAGTGGRNTLQGDIYLPGGRRLDRSVLVKLGTSRGEIWTTSSGNGSFQFRQLHGGRYTVNVDIGEDFAPATETVDMPDTSSGLNRPGQTFMVQIYLRPLAGKSARRASVISADSPPQRAVELYEQAILSAKNGQRDKAIEQLKSAISIHPAFVAALNGLGVQYLKLSEYKKASEAFAKAIKFQPDNPILHFNLGVALFRLREFAQAEAELSKVTEKHAASASAHFYRGRAFVGLRRLADAEKEFKRVVEIGGDDVALAYRYLAGIYLEWHERAKALDALTHYRALVPDSSETPQILELINKLKSSAGKK